MGSDQKDADVIFTPDEDSQNYCMASIICDENGTLYYTNDSGKLFSLSNTNVETPDLDDDKDDESSSSSEGSSQDPSSESSNIQS